MGCHGHLLPGLYDRLDQAQTVWNCRPYVSVQHLPSVTLRTLMDIKYPKINPHVSDITLPLTITTVNWIIDITELQSITRTLLWARITNLTLLTYPSCWHNVTVGSSKLYGRGETGRGNPIENNTFEPGVSLRHTYSRLLVVGQVIECTVYCTCISKALFASSEINVSHVWLYNLDRSRGSRVRCWPVTLYEHAQCGMVWDATPLPVIEVTNNIYVFFQMVH